MHRPNLYEPELICPDSETFELHYIHSILCCLFDDFNWRTYLIFVVSQIKITAKRNMSICKPLSVFFYFSAMHC